MSNFIEEFYYGNIEPQALSTENRSAWVENGSPVEQGKETVQWAKLGYLLGEDGP